VTRSALGPTDQQIELEEWCRRVGAERALSGKWETGANYCLGNRLAALYLAKVIEVWERSKNSPGRQAHIWQLLHCQKAVEHVALESLVYVLANVGAGRTLNGLAAQLGKRAEMVLFLTHPVWGGGQHLKGLKLANGGTLDMGAMINRLKDKGFRKAQHYRQLQPVERIGLGLVFLECIQMATKMIEIYVETRRARRYRMVRYTENYWQFLNRWKDSLTLFKPSRMPMLVPPKAWTGHSEGGFLTMPTTVSTVDWARWPEVSKHMQPCVLGAINQLQAVPHQWDHRQVDLMLTLWDRGHRIGSLPPRERMQLPKDSDFKEQGLGPSAYWQAMYEFRADQKRDAQRTALVNATIGYRRLQSAEQLHWVWSMDHRGRLYQRGGQLSTQGTDHFRTLFQFKEQSPVKGHEEELGLSITDAYGIKGDRGQRLKHFWSMTVAYKRVGENPLEMLAFIEAAKEPFRFVQLCRDLAGYFRDPGYTSGTIHWLDQTCSGWGHVACLTADQTLAQYTNVIGQVPADLYSGVGRLVETRIQWKLRHAELEDKQRACLEWWHGQQVPRSFWKETLMPVIYGRSYLSLTETIVTFCHNELNNFLTPEGIRIIDLARSMGSVVTEVVNEALPNIRDLARWLGKVAVMQIDAGLRPYWFTPNGMAIESYASETRRDMIELHLAGRKVRCDVRQADHTKPDRKKSVRKLVPDYIHSQDAAFLQRFINHWSVYKHPINSVHDCFGTTLEHVGTLRSELNDQWARFYSVDYLELHRMMVTEVLKKPVPAPPMVGTLDRSRIGENMYLFS